MLEAVDSAGDCWLVVFDSAGAALLVEPVVEEVGVAAGGGEPKKSSKAVLIPETWVSAEVLEVPVGPTNKSIKSEEKAIVVTEGSGEADGGGAAPTKAPNGSFDPMDAPGVGAATTAG